MNKRVVNVCQNCGDTFEGMKKSKWCKDCRRDRAYSRTRSFLREHPEYLRAVKKSYRERIKRGVIVQPSKSAAIHQANLIASANRQGWRVEFIHREGKWKWSAEKNGAVLSSATEFEDFNEARKDFLEAVF